MNEDSISEVVHYDQWKWDERTVIGSMVLDKRKRTATFPLTSESTIAVVGDTPLKPGLIHYFEIIFRTPLSGTDIMIGVGTENADRTNGSYCSLIGLNDQSWGYSYRGYLQHNGHISSYTCGYHCYEIIGVLLDRFNGTLEFFHQSDSAGIAFKGIDKTKDLYPMVSSTSARIVVNIGYCASVQNSLQARALVKLCQTDNGLRTIRMVPGLRQLLMTNFWMINRDLDEDSEVGRTIKPYLSVKGFCWEHYAYYCNICIDMVQKSYLEDIETRKPKYPIFAKFFPLSHRNS